jgi:uncharacterized membrane protein YhaH (DUF805 family)
MTPIDWALRPFRRYADFSGRAPRAEYWWYRLGIGVLGFILAMLDLLVLHGPIYGNRGILGIALGLACALPSIALLVRRLHDIDRSGWWAVVQIPMYSLAVAGKSPLQAGTLLKTLPTGLNILAALTWAVAAILLFVFVLTPGTEGPNRYGPDPYGSSELEEVFA